MQTFLRIREAAPGADVIAAGYPLVVAAPEEGACHNPVVNRNVDAADRRAIRRLAAHLADRHRAGPPAVSAVESTS